MLRLYVTRPMTARATAAISAKTDATFRDNNTPPSLDEMRQILRDYDVVMPTLGDPLQAPAFEGGGLRTRLLASFGAGYNHIDPAAARAAGIAVTNTPDVVTPSTADIALMLILMVCRGADNSARELRAGRWTGWHPTQYLGRHLGSLTVGIIGMGRIGQAIARRCHDGFGMKVIYCGSRTRPEDLPFPAERLDDLDSTLRACDVAVLAVPGGPETTHLIGKKELEALGPDSFLINIARGTIVDEQALIEALENGTIAGAGLDVFEHEPSVPQRLLDAPNATLLPHLGTAAEEIRTDMALRALSNIVAFDEGKPLPDLVN